MRVLYLTTLMMFSSAWGGTSSADFYRSLQITNDRIDEFLMWIKESPNREIFIDEHLVSRSDTGMLQTLQNNIKKLLADSSNDVSLVSFATNGKHCSFAEQQEQDAWKRTIFSDICGEEKWYRLAQLTFPQAKRMIDVGGNRGFVGALMLSLWGGDAYVTPWNLHTEVRNSGHFAMNRHTFGFCKTGRDRGIAWNCHQNTRDASTGSCVGSEADIRVVSFDASSYTASSMNSIIHTIQQSKPAFRPHTWKFEHMAVSNQEGTAQFPAQSKSSRPGFEGGHLLRNSVMKEDYETVPVITLDAYLARNDFGDVDILKIDAEGHDAFVLEGAEATIKKGVALLTWEVAKGVDFSASIVKYESYGYSCYLTSNVGLYKLGGDCSANYLSPPRPSPGNIFCISRRLAPVTAIAFDLLSFPVLTSFAGVTGDNEKAFEALMKRSRCQPWPECIFE